VIDYFGVGMFSEIVWTVRSCSWRPTITIANRSTHADWPTTATLQSVAKTVFRRTLLRYVCLMSKQIRLSSVCLSSITLAHR